MYNNCGTFFLQLPQNILFLRKLTVWSHEKNVPFSNITESGIFMKLERMKFEIGNDDLQKFKTYYEEIDEFFKNQTH